MKIVKEMTFDAAHRLPGHSGACRNLHGHTYRLRVTVSDTLNESGMVVDFGLLAKQIKERYDHATILDITTADGLLDLCRRNGWKVVRLHGSPTAERIAQDIAERMKQKPDKVELWETPTSKVVWRPE